MNRIPLINPADTTGERQSILSDINAAFGATPNMFKAVANSPAALKSMWGSFGAMGGGILSAELGEKIAVAIANYNSCQYCLSAHTALGRKAGATSDEMSLAQQGQSSDARTAAALQFSLRVVEGRGQVEEADLQSLRDNGYSDEAIVEILAHVALNLFTNYINVAFAVPVDFPAVKLR